MSQPEEPLADDPRARAARTKRDRTRRALLDAADSIFGSRGWGRTRMEDIAAAAGVSAATAYNHFPTKHALVGHVFDPVIRPLLVQAQHDIAIGRPAADALKDQVIGLARLSGRYRVLMSAFWAAVEDHTLRVGAVPDPEGPDADIDPRLIAPVPLPITLLIEYGQRRGELRTYPAPSEMSATIVNVLLMRAVNRPTESPADLAELLLTVMFGALKPELLIEDPCAERPFRDLR
ncbi:TetR/AcrR family transcriptional regulator [Pseudonocardia sp. CA-107938]|uniref:TetR/AcrR family transcriptional regulator n=1 Tax=Pseudonocardia sp. CA-107938 TaxID=3240021 RepID=UPI003D90D6E4